jgi:type IV secretion system protein VirB8
MNRDPAIEAYLAEAVGWERDRCGRAERSAQRAWWVAGSAALLAGLAILAVLFLTPLKSVQPYVIRVDNTSGVVDVVPTYTGRGEMPELVTRSLLNQYVTTRERYFYAMAEVDYDTVGAFQSGPLNQQWMAAWDRGNPASPLIRFRDGTTVRAQTQSISFIKRASGENDLAQVRFLTALRQGGTGAEQVAHWIATIQYTYVKPSSDEKQRTLNPLGFRILDYRKEPEVLEAPSTVAGVTP